MDREQALDAALSQIERQYGKGSVMKMSDQAQVAIPSISTGSLSLDVALGVYEREARPWLPHLTVLRFKDRPRLHPSVPDWGASCRPTRLFTYLGCAPVGRSMSHSK